MVVGYIMIWIKLIVIHLNVWKYYLKSISSLSFKYLYLYYFSPVTWCHILVYISLHFTLLSKYWPDNLRPNAWSGICQYAMMTSSNGNIFRVIGICAGNSPVPGEFPTQRPVTRSFDVFFDLRLNKRLSKQSWGWWFETLSPPLWRHCNASFFLTSRYWGRWMRG